MRGCLAIPTLALLTFGCGRIGYGPVDAAPPDTGTFDATPDAVLDSEAMDAPVVDATPDGEPMDSRVEDGAPPDAEPDGGEPDGSLGPLPEVAVGGFSTCVRLTSGRVACIGCNGLGALGDGTGVDSMAFVDVVGITDAVSIRSGDEHVCVVHRDATGSCWGWNNSGSLGDGTSTNALSPVGVMIASDLAQLTPARTATCALLASGEVRCFGDNFFGQLGDGTRVARSTPETVMGLPDVAQVEGSEGNFCARTPAGEVYCWGWGASGQIGNGATTSYQTTPARAGSITDAVDIAVGHQHACAVLSTGELWCWGSNSQGELGDPSVATNRSTPGPVEGLTNVVGVAGGYVHTCALLSTGEVRCFGWAARGNLGDGQTAMDQYSPSIPVIGLDDAVQISAGTIDGPTCAVRATGDVVCWGPNNCGMLGDGTTDDSAVPVPLPLPTSTL